MQTGFAIRIRVCGAFQVESAGGEVLTPKGRKECGLLALLALGKGLRRSREALQDKLWSESEAPKAQASLRRALANIRKSLGPYAEILQCDRLEVRLDPARVEVLRDPEQPGDELLETPQVKDPEFENWLRDLRQRAAAGQPGPEAGARTGARTGAGPFPGSFPGPVPVPSAPLAGQKPRSLFVIQQVTDPGSDAEAMASEAVRDAIAKRLLALDGITVLLPDCPVEPGATTTTVELRSAVENGSYYLFLRLVYGIDRICFWSDRLTCDLQLDKIVSSPDLAAFLSRALDAIVTNNPGARAVPTPGYALVHRTAMLLFTGNRDKILEAQTILRDLHGPDSSGCVAAWRAFGLLTQSLEFGERRPQLVETALALAEEALTAGGADPVVPALASIVNVKLNGDFDYGHHLALKACALGDQNPYALNAMSQACFFRGEFERGYQLSKKAQFLTNGMRNSHYWDIQACLAALGVGKIDRAFEYARKSHIEWPGNRPSLRYLVALSILKDDWPAARLYAGKLRRLEPDFDFAALTSASYPVETLRRVGLQAELSAKLATA